MANKLTPRNLEPTNALEKTLRSIVDTDTAGEVKLGIGSDTVTVQTALSLDSTIAVTGNATVGGTLGVTGAATFTAGQQSSTVARTATDDGTGAGTIADGTTMVLLDADGDANHICVLPTPTPGTVVYIIEDGTTGYELRSSAPATIAINGGTGASAESAIAGATTYIRCVCTSATTWVCNQYAANGTESAVTAAA
jgi:hypothetical protein